MFRQDFTCPALLRSLKCLLTRMGLSPSMAILSRLVLVLLNDHWPGPRSLATTSGVSVLIPFLRVLRCFSSPGLKPPMYSGEIYLTVGGFPHSEIHGSNRSVRNLPSFSQLYYVLHRLSMPRHPPDALCA